MTRKAILGRWDTITRSTGVWCSEGIASCCNGLLVTRDMAERLEWASCVNFSNLKRDQETLEDYGRRMTASVAHLQCRASNASIYRLAVSINNKNKSKYWLKAACKPGAALNTDHALSHCDVTVVPWSRECDCRWGNGGIEKESRWRSWNNLVEESGIQAEWIQDPALFCSLLHFTLKILAGETHVGRCTNHEYTVQCIIPGAVKLQLTGQFPPATCL